MQCHSRTRQLLLLATEAEVSVLGPSAFSRDTFTRYIDPMRMPGETAMVSVVPGGGLLDMGVPPFTVYSTFAVGFTGHRRSLFGGGFCWR